MSEYLENRTVTLTRLDWLFIGMALLEREMQHREAGREGAAQRIREIYQKLEADVDLP